MTTAQAPVWVVASTATSTRWTAALAAAGVTALALPWSLVRVDTDEGLQRLREGGHELVLFTSAYAPEALPAEVGAGIEAACVGARTEAAARAQGFTVTWTGDAGGDALARALLEARPGLRRVLHLCGRDRREELRRHLEDAGVAVESVSVYAADADPAFDAAVRAAPEPACVVVGSPRALDALVEAGIHPQVVVAPGATTADAAMALQETRVVVAARPDPEALVEAVRSALEPGRNPEA